MADWRGGTDGGNERWDASQDAARHAGMRPSPDAAITTQASFEDAVEAYARESERRSIALRRARGQL